MKKIISIVSLFILFISCSKDNSNDTETPTTTTLYVAGTSPNVNNSNKPIATIWIEGVPTQLPTTLGYESVANSIFVDGENVYVVGVEYFNFSPKAVLWKNGVKITLSQLESTAHDIYVINNTPYIVGNVENKATLWYGNSSTLISNGGSDANSITVYDDKLYIAGNENSQAIIWRSLGNLSSTLNLESFVLTTNSGNGYGVTIKDNSFFTAVNTSNQAQIYKGLNIFNNLGDDTRIYDIGILDQDIISVGRSDASQIGKATLWKNDTPTLLSNMSSLAEDVFIVGEDIYVAGYEIFNNRLTARLWVNGEMKIISDENSTALSVFVTSN